jgi:hypothetical protein
MRGSGVVIGNLDDERKPVRGEAPENLLQGRVVPFAVLQDRLRDIGTQLAEAAHIRNFEMGGRAGMRYVALGMHPPDRVLVAPAKGHPCVF